MKTERYNGVTRIIDIGDELDLRKTLNCGQAFRWKEIDNTGTFNGVIGNDGNINITTASEIATDGRELENG